MGTKIITISRDFSRYPAGRFRTDGPWSGQKFREELLIPALRDFDHVIIQMDGARGYGSSFLEEAFGGLIRVERLTLDELKQKLEIRASDRSLHLEIWENIEKAKPTGARA
jgi:hypothetical protein